MGQAENPGIILAFKERFFADREAGRRVGLTEYQNRFPGYELLISLEYEKLDRPSESVEDGGLTLADGRFRIIREIGRGGQAIVYEAENTAEHRKVALKVLRFGVQISKGGLERFRREAEITARLAGKGVCPIDEVGLDDGRCYIAMGYVEGETLSAKIARAALDGAMSDGVVPLAAASKTMGGPGLDRLLEVFGGIARALQAAHEQGVVHRDVKPGNIMIDDGGNPVIVDFGLARDERDDEGLTRTGEIPGTPVYMSPEQIGAQTTSVDKRSDVYSLGATLFECVTLKRPFEAATRDALYREILNAEIPDPLRLNPHLPRPLRAVLECAMAKNPDRRYLTAGALAEDIERLRRGARLEARRPSPLLRLGLWSKRQPAIATAAAAVLVFLVTGIAWSAVKRAELNDANRELRRAMEMSHQLTGEAEQHRQEAERQAEEARKAESSARAAAEAKNRALNAYLRLGDAKRVQDLFQSAETLWPAVPEKVAEMQQWLAETGQLAERLSDHETALAEVRNLAVPNPDATEDLGDRPFQFNDAATQWRHDMLARLVADLKRLVDPVGSVFAAVKKRVGLAMSVRQATLEEHRDAWQSTISAIAASPVYRGLALAPQIGLIPLGPDPTSGLFEFLHWATHDGPLPKRDQRGRLILTDHSGLILVLLPASEFVMGAQAKDPDRPSFDPSAIEGESPPHPVTLDAFFVSKFEMTQDQWSRSTGDNPSRFTHGRKAAGVTVSSRHPVETISWQDATSAMQRFGLVLPTEAQWEYAARAGTTTPWYSGSSRESLADTANLADEAAKRAGLPSGTSVTEPGIDDGHAIHAPVGSYLPNAFGIHDLAGNVAEWCRDGFQPYSQPGRPGDEPDSTDREESRIHRGGGFDTPADAARSAKRGFADPGHRRQGLGLRPVRLVD